MSSKLLNGPIRCSWSLGGLVRPTAMSAVVQATVMLGQPFWLGHAVVVDEGDEFAPGGVPTSVAGAGWTRIHRRRMYRQLVGLAVGRLLQLASVSSVERSSTTTTSNGSSMSWSARRRAGAASGPSDCRWGPPPRRGARRWTRPRDYRWPSRLHEVRRLVTNAQWRQPPLVWSRGGTNESGGIRPGTNSALPWRW